jgi:anaerobic selenocysteine-containing dehydrogenase
MRQYSPEWAQALCDVPAKKIREVAQEFVAQACVGQTTEVDGKLLPYRPVAVTLGKTVNNGWGAYECCWSRTLLAVLVGALEVPGGILGTTVRINSPREDRHKSVQPGPDGFMLNKLNPPPGRGKSASGAARICRCAAGLEPVARSLAPGLDVPDPRAQELAAPDRARHLVCLPHQPVDLVLGHAQRG